MIGTVKKNGMGQVREPLSTGGRGSVLQQNEAREQARWTSVGKAFHTEGTASADALRQACAWCVRGKARKLMSTQRTKGRE